MDTFNTPEKPPVNKFRVLLDFERQDITLSQAADLLESRTPSDVMKSLVAYRAHLPYLIEMSDRLSLRPHTQNERRQVIEEISQRLGVTPRQVNRMMKGTNVITPATYKSYIRQLAAQEANEKWRVRFNCALSVIAGLDRMDDAAERAEVSSRQMYRWVNKLLFTQEITLRELGKLTVGKRKTIADRIEETQGEYFEHDLNK